MIFFGEMKIAFELWGVVFVFLAFVSLLPGGKTNKVGMALSHLLAADCILLISDAFSYANAGNLTAAGMLAVRVTRFIAYAIVPVMSALFAFYLRALSNRTARNFPAALLRLLMLVCSFHFASIVINRFTGMIYYLDADNIYHRGAYYSVASGSAAVELLLLVALVISIRKRLHKNEMIAILAFITLPFASNIIQTLFYGISINGIAVTLALMMLYYTHQLGKNRRLASQQNELMRHKLLLAEQQKTIAEKEQALTQKQLQLSMSQIRPHFIFNALGSIEQLCKIDPSRAAEATHYFSVFLRRNLLALNSCELVPIEKELEHVRAYIWLEKMRFGDDINYTEQIDAAGFGIPSLSIQPLVENAVKHGMMGMEEGQISIRVLVKEYSDYYCITVSDNGCGFDAGKITEEPDLHVGIRNVRERLEMMVGGSMELRSYIGAGTEAHITVPKKQF